MKTNYIGYIFLYGWCIIGLCKTYSDGKRIRLTSDFLYDSQNHVLTIVKEEMSYDEFAYMMHRHVSKVKKKYPLFKLIIPERYSEYYNKYTTNGS